MKAVTVLLVLLLFWYFAGMFHQSALLIASVLLAVLTVLLTVLTIYQKRRLNLTLKNDKDIAFKRIEKAVDIIAENNSRLPVNRYRVKLQLRYSTDKKYVTKKYGGCAGSNTMNSENISECYLTAPYCGIIELRLKNMKVYDPMSVFSSGKKLNTSGQILVFPVEKPVRILMPLSGSHDNIPLAETYSNKPGDDHTEVRLIREYRPGDLARHIHRNYSARTDSLWVKEFSKENDYIFDLLLDTSYPDITTEQWDAFYEIVFSVMAALLKMDYFINVYFYDKSKNGLTEFRITEDSDCAELLARLYMAEKQCSKEELYAGFRPGQKGLMIITTQGEWSFSGKAVYRFHTDKVEQELSSIPFQL